VTRLSIIFPIYNEEKLLLKEDFWDYYNTLKSNPSLDIHLCNGGSSDQSQKILEQRIDDQNKYFLHSKNFTAPSIAKSIELAFSKINTEYLLILPIDCKLVVENIDKLLKKIESQNPSWGFFLKKYSPDNLALRTLAFVLNYFRSIFCKEAVWTNAFFCHRNILNKVKWPNSSFLEDLLLSEEFNKISKPLIIKDFVFVDSRRYYPRTHHRIIKNIIILMVYRLGFRDFQKLRKFYRS